MASDTSLTQKLGVEENSETPSNCFHKKCGQTCTKVSEDLLRFFLRLFLFSPLKWKEKACWISGVHLFLLSVHITKIAVLTILIGTCRTSVYTTVYEGYNTLRHALLLHWDAGDETLPYPPSHGAFAAYAQTDFHERVNYAVQQYFNLETEATAYFRRLPGDNITIKVVYFDLIKDPLFNDIVDLNSYEERSIEPLLGLENQTNKNGKTSYTYNITKDLEPLNLTTVLERTLELDVRFSLYSLRVQRKQNDARCLHIFGNVTFDNNYHNGEVDVNLNTYTLPIHCSKMGYRLKDSPQCRNYNNALAKTTNGLAICTLCVDSIMFIAGVTTLVITFVYMKKHYTTIFKSTDEKRTNLPFSEYFWNVQWWNCLSVTGDGFTASGLHGLIKDNEEHINKPLRDWDRSTIHLGIGCLLTWFSFLRFIRISHKFSLLFKTIRKAALDVIFFLICAVIIFFGFWASTYIVLGPYHIKFKTEHSAAETLFSIINGDEIFATFAILQDSYAGDASGIKWFSRIIIYIYVSLFTVIVFNLLIALFNSAYEVVKNQYSDMHSDEYENDQDDNMKTLSDYMRQDFKKKDNEKDKNTSRCHIVNYCFCKIERAILHQSRSDGSDGGDGTWEHPFSKSKSSIKYFPAAIGRLVHRI